MSFFLISDGINITKIKVLKYEDSNAEDEYDKKWILCSVCVQGASLKTETEVSLWDEDFIRFDKKIENLLNDKSESAIFDTLEEGIKIELVKINCLGSFNFKINLKSELWNLDYCYQITLNDVLKFKVQIEEIIKMCVDIRCKGIASSKSQK